MTIEELFEEWENKEFFETVKDKLHESTYSYRFAEWARGFSSQIRGDEEHGGTK